MPRRSLPQWIALGALAGFAGLVRWQSVLFALLPAIEALAALWRAGRARDTASLAPRSSAALAFTVAAVAAFTPQMLAWKAIYGHYLAVSPVGPQIFWRHPHLVDVLFASQNGLFAMSPILYVAAIGLVIFARRQAGGRRAVADVVAAMVYFNASIQDWWGSAGYGGRRFDGTLPLFVLGAAAALEGSAALLARRPRLAAAAVLAALAVVERDVPRRRPRRHRHGRRPDRLRRRRRGTGAHPAPLDRASVLVSGQPLVRGAPPRVAGQLRPADDVVHGRGDPAVRPRRRRRRRSRVPARGLVRRPSAKAVCRSAGRRSRRRWRSPWASPPTSTCRSGCGRSRCRGCRRP